MAETGTEVPARSMPYNSVGMNYRMSSRGRLGVRSSATWVDGGEAGSGELVVGGGTGVGERGIVWGREQRRGDGARSGREFLGFGGYLVGSGKCEGEG